MTSGNMGNSRPRSFRCARCDTNWPPISECRICPRCMLGTDESHFDPEYTFPDARKIVDGWTQWRKVQDSADWCDPYCLRERCQEVRRRYPDPRLAVFLDA